MRSTYLLFISFVCIAACNNADDTYTDKKDTVIKRDTFYVDRKDDPAWQEGFGLTHDPYKDTVWHKPVSYYITDTKCALIATEFYYGYFRPSDDGATAELLKLACDDNDKLRPFYRWCLNKTLQISDGVLGEMTGVPARRYAEKFPKEFFHYMQEDSSGERSRNWVNEISYSGFYNEEDYRENKKVRNNFMQKMLSNCRDCNDNIITWIKKFTADCFHLED